MEENQLQNSNNKPKKNGVAITISVVFNILLALLIVILVFRLIIAFNFTGFYIVGSSMDPTLNGAEERGVKGGDYLYVDANDTPTYSDIVIAHVHIESENKDGSEAEDRDIIKRVIACGGDSVYILEGVVYIKYSGTDEFVPLPETYIAEENNSPVLNNYPEVRGKVDTKNGILVPEGSYFLLGDNRNVSYDSRKYGCFSSENIVGVVTDWSLSLKAPISWVYNLFHFGL